MGDATGRRDTFILPYPRHDKAEAPDPSTPEQANVNEVTTTRTDSAVPADNTEQEPDASPLKPMEATLREFNRHITMAVLTSQQQFQMQSNPDLQDQKVQNSVVVCEKRQRETAIAAEEEEKEDKSFHILMPNLGRGRILCRLCSKRGLKTRTRYGCVQCRLGFHVECFAVFHNPSTFEANTSETVQDALDVIRRNSPSRPATRRRLNNSIRSFEELTLPTVSDAQDD